MTSFCTINRPNFALSLRGGAYYILNEDLIYCYNKELLHRLTIEHEKAHAEVLKTFVGRLKLRLMPNTSERDAWRVAARRLQELA